MIYCEELTGKIVQRFSLFEDGPYGPEIHIEFTDGTVFNGCLKTSTALQAQLLRKVGDEEQTLKDLTVSSVG